MNGSQLKDRLIQTSEVIGYYEKNKIQSAGRLSASNALKDIRPERPSIPKTWDRQEDKKATPHPYTNFFQQTYRWSYPGATRVRVHFAKFSSEAGCDIATVKDSKGQTVIKYSGELGSFMSADALGDTLQIDFKSDHAFTDYGFDVDYVEVSYEKDLWYTLFKN
jgi:hypothetical protein